MVNVIDAEIIENYQPATEIRELPYKVRLAVAAAPNIESKFATLKKFYPDVKQDPNDPENFYVTNEKGQTLQLNKEGFNAGDVIDVARPIAQAVGGTIGAVKGGALGSVPGAVAGAGLGTAAGSEAIELVGSKLFGTEILRTPSELATERAVDVALGAGGQLITPPLIKGFKYLFTGGQKGAEATLKRLTDFAEAGVSPSLGQATMNRGVQTVELFMGNVPGSGKVIANFAQKAQDDLGTQATKIASSLINKPTPASTIQAGRQISLGIGEQGLSGQNSFVGRFKSRAGQLFGEVDNYVQPETKISLETTLNELKKQVAPIPSAEKTSSIFRNKFLNEVFENLQQDIAINGELPYNAVKQVRSKIGNKLSEISLVPDIDKAQLKLVYGALSKDLENSLAQQGTKALNTYKRANNYYRAGLDRIENYLEPITRVADPDRLTSLLLNSAKEGSTRINAVKKSLTDDQYKVFLSSVVDRMGRIRPSVGIATEAAGEVVDSVGAFSSETFLTNWNSLNKSAKDVLFSGKGLQGIRSDLDTVARISSVIRESGKTFKNPSGTADRLVGQGFLFGGIASAASGNPAYIVGLPLAIASASQAAKLMTNPSFIRWMANGVKIANNKGFTGAVEHIGRLGVVMGNSDSETRQHIQNVLQMFINGGEKYDPKIKKINMPKM